MTLWTASDAVRATGGQASTDWQASGISIDTRSLKEGDLFIALKAARDGHDFVAQALNKGAAAAMVDHIPEGVPDDAPLLVVPDVMAALTALGAAGRARSRARVIAVTGSVGKTSTKEMLRDMLSGFGKTHAAEASFNNHWGVPVTLARLAPDADFAVIEIGMNQPGEIAPLAQLTRPHVAMITTIAPAHLEAFENIDGIAHEKASIFNALGAEGHAVFPCDLPTSPILRDAAMQSGATIWSFGYGSDRVRPADMTQTEAALVLRAHVGDMRVSVRLANAGAHFGMNGLGCLAVAQALGLDLARAALGLGHWQPPAGRGLRQTIVLDSVEELGFTLIDDAFNANPASLEAALEMLAKITPAQTQTGRRGRRIAILGDMLELGPDEQSLHEAIAQYPAIAAVDLVHCVGPRMAALSRRLPLRQRGRQVAQADDLTGLVHLLVAPGDVVLVKGSKGSLVSRVVDALRNLAVAEPGSRAHRKS
ncbi:UDP-N-acetylmuramoyl-tripeptide--D-alanyl-D-alanine ligase [Roseinatronobacter alkalisoli]|uniref:UDP-N-acetylmuramoyl-tripeptide--D-alanyl-D-alanine ligase n=1 Tax=Roseinatronobacter alkalisoli TaxID=3028235 RepID=A0ABT5T9V9_9RHOB|nr:UDP-N-acetylmuramoyl-tripeptide--D-alanyl-D-alanine ligase [Roseinatronobacter sp. HJB301]MDD7970713.1 UDP-N-acetylmuramoyl-tripeptide--D-alanyl-D-alanine ligase [Roseinatronobacter sp. HJB301]